MPKKFSNFHSYHKTIWQKSKTCKIAASLIHLKDCLFSHSSTLLQSNKLLKPFCQSLFEYISCFIECRKSLFYLEYLLSFCLIENIIFLLPLNSKHRKTFIIQIFVKNDHLFTHWWWIGFKFMWFCISKRTEFVSEVKMILINYCKNLNYAKCLSFRVKVI